MVNSNNITIRLESIITKRIIYPKLPLLEIPQIGSTIEISYNEMYIVQHIHLKIDNYNNGHLAYVYLEPISSSKFIKIHKSKKTFLSRFINLKNK